MFCLCLSANLPSGSENMSVTEFPVFLALVKPVFLCISPVCCNTPGQCLLLLLPPSSTPTRCSELLQHPRSCCVPSMAWAHVGGAGRLLPALMPLLFSTGKVWTLPCASLGDRCETVSLFYLSVAVAHRTGGALLYSTSCPSDKLGRNFSYRGEQ